MKPDLSFINLNKDLCNAVEIGGTICFNKIQCKGYCHKHYTRLRRLNSVNLPVKKVRKCKFIDCEEIYHCHGFCVKHYHKHMRQFGKNKCTADECNNYALGKYCSKHRSRLERYGTLLGSGKKKGGNFKPGNTYIRIKEYKICLAIECERDSNIQKITKGLCPKHYQRWRRAGVNGLALKHSAIPSGRI